MGFTPVSEKLDPQALTDWLDDYLEAMAPYVMRHDGIILKYIGDGIMAAFGVPLARETEIRDAIHRQDATRHCRGRRKCARIYTSRNGARRELVHGERQSPHAVSISSARTVTRVEFSLAKPHSMI